MSPDTLSHILCIDDEDDILEVAKMALEIVGGYKVTCCYSGEEGISQVQTQKPDIILLDVMMPDMDGPATLKKMHEVIEPGSIPVIFMTARVQPDEVKEYIEKGGTAVIGKPFDPMTLADQVKAIWQKHKQGGAKE